MKAFSEKETKITVPEGIRRLLPPWVCPNHPGVIFVAFDLSQDPFEVAFQANRQPFPLQVLVALLHWLGLLTHSDVAAAEWEDVFVWKGPGRGTPPMSHALVLLEDRRVGLVRACHNFPQCGALLAVGDVCDSCAKPEQQACEETVAALLSSVLGAEAGAGLPGLQAGVAAVAALLASAAGAATSAGLPGCWLGR